jgi:hypothetical protein
LYCAFRRSQDRFTRRLTLDAQNAFSNLRPSIVFTSSSAGAAMTDSLADRLVVSIRHALQLANEAGSDMTAELLRMALLNESQEIHRAKFEGVGKPN